MWEKESRKRDGNNTAFGDTRERLAELHRVEEIVDRAIAQGIITMKNIPKQDTKEIKEQNTRNRTRTVIITPAVAPTSNSADTNQIPNGLTAG